MGAEGRGSSRDPPFGGPLPYRGAEGRGWESPSVAGKTSNPSLGNVPSGGNDGGGPSPSPTPSPHPCPQSGMVGEVANRFPGQHRGRLGWSLGHGGSRSYPARCTPFSLGWHLAQPNTAPIGPSDPLAPPVLPPEVRAALVATASLWSVMLRVQLEVQAGHPG